MSFDRFARPRPFVTKEIFYVAWCDFGRACITALMIIALVLLQRARVRRQEPDSVRVHRAPCLVRVHQHLVFELTAVFAALSSSPV